jgi:hypothetical protein
MIQVYQETLTIDPDVEPEDRERYLAEWRERTTTRAGLWARYLGATLVEETIEAHHYGRRGGTWTWRFRADLDHGIKDEA